MANLVLKRIIYYWSKFQRFRKKILKQKKAYRKLLFYEINFGRFSRSSNFLNFISALLKILSKLQAPAIVLVKKETLCKLLYLWENLRFETNFGNFWRTVGNSKILYIFQQTGFQRAKQTAVSVKDQDQERV